MALKNCCNASEDPPRRSILSAFQSQNDRQTEASSNDMTDQVKKLYIKTHGCQMNEYDSSRMADMLGERHQMVVTQTPDEAAVILQHT